MDETKDAECKVAQENAPLISDTKKRVITKVVAKITVETVEDEKPFGKIEGMFKRAHTIKELEEIAADVNNKALVVYERKSILDYIKKLAYGVMELFIES